MDNLSDRICDVPDFIDSVFFDISPSASTPMDSAHDFDQILTSVEETDIDSVTLDEICATTFHNEPIWRCATLLTPAPAPDAFMERVGEPAEYISRPKLARERAVNAMADDLQSSNCYSLFLPKSDLYSVASPCPSSSAAPKINHLTAPEIPLLLMPTHFEVLNLSLGDLVSKLECFLRDVAGLSFFQGNFEWDVVYINGPSHCKLEIHIYMGYTSGYIVETNKLNGDTALFRSFFSQLKADINASDEFEYDSFAVFTPLPMPTCILSESNDTCGLGPIFRMAQSQFIDSQVEASRTLCELSADESMRESLCELGCVEVVKQLLGSSCKWVQNHAAVVLANLSDSWGCHEAIIRGDVLPTLLALGSDGNYQYKEIRVLAVYVLANVSSSCASAVVNNIGPETVASWFRKIDAQDTDERLRLHAQRALGSLTAVLCV